MSVTDISGRRVKRQAIVCAATLVAAGAAVYAPSLHAPFIFDDHGSIVDNPNIRQLWPPGLAMSAPSQAPTAGRPVACLSFALNYVCGDLSPTGYHLFNIAVHLVCALLLMGIVRRTLTMGAGGSLREPRALAPAATGTPGYPRGLKPAARGGAEASPGLKPAARSGPVARSAGWIAAAVAAIWMMHPLQTDAVTYVTQRTELLMAMFYLLTVYCFIRGWASPRRGAWFVAAFMSCALGMGSKEVMFTAPLMVLLYDRTFVAGSFRSALRCRWSLHLPLATTWIVLAMLMASGPRSESIGFGHGISMLDYLATQAGVIVHYVRLSFWPTPLVISYDDWPIARALADVPMQLFAVVGLFVVTIWALWRKPRAGFLGAWFFLILAPTSSFVPVATEVVAERRMYLALAAIVAGVVLVGVGVLTTVFQRLAVRASVRTLIAGTLVTGLVVLLACRTLERNRAYRSPLAIWTDVLAVRPDNALAHSGLGLALTDLGKPGEAFDHFVEAVNLKPRDAKLHFNLGKALHARGEYESARQRFLKAILLRPGYAQAHNSLGNTLTKMGRIGKARQHYEEALRIDPACTNAHGNLANLLVQQGEIGKASAHYAEVVRLDPDDVSAGYNLGVALLKLGKVDEALGALRRVVRIDPTRAAAHYQLGKAFLAAGASDEAVRAYREALRLQPDYAAAKHALDALMESHNKPIVP